MKASVALSITCVLLLSAGASAHHSFDATYDLNREVTIEGRVVQALIRNPHSFLHLEASDQNGEVQKWAFEWRGSGGLAKAGITRGTLKPGDEVVVTFNPPFKKYERRGVLTALQRTSDGLQWAEKKRRIKKRSES